GKREACGGRPELGDAGAGRFGGDRGRPGRVSGSVSATGRARLSVRDDNGSAGVDRHWSLGLVTILERIWLAGEIRGGRRRSLYGSRRRIRRGHLAGLPLPQSAGT